MQNLFEQSQLKGFASIIISCWKSDYSYFINLFIAFPFSLTDGSHEAHIIVYCLFGIVPTFLLALLVSLSFVRDCSLKQKTWMLIFSGIGLFMFPLFHFAALLGMPDVIGLFCCFAIFLLLFPEDYIHFSFVQSLLLAFLSVVLIVTRRWYLFWLMGFIPAWFSAYIVRSFVQSKRQGIQTLLALAKMALVVSGVMILALAPFIYHTLFQRSYSKEYASYNLGGFPFELFNQLGYLGILCAILLLIGLFCGIRQKKYRLVSVSTIIAFFLTVFLFTRVQNMGKHQSLCLFPYYLIFLYEYISMCIRSKHKLIKYFGLGFFIIVFVLNDASTLLIWHDDLDGVFLFTKYAISSRFKWTL